MTNAQAVARVVRSITDTLKRRNWDVNLSRSNRSLSRYILAKKGNRKLTIRVSDHPPSKKSSCELNYLYWNYRQKRLVDYLDNNRTRNKKYSRPRRKR